MCTFVYYFLLEKEKNTFRFLFNICSSTILHRSLVNDPTKLEYANIVAFSRCRNVLDEFNDVPG